MASELVDIEEFLFVPRLLLKCFGVTSVKRENELVFGGSALFLLAVGNMLGVIFCEVVYVRLSIAGTIEFNLQEICFIFLCLSYMLWSLLKISYLIGNKRKICLLLAELRAIHPKSIAAQRKYGIAQHVESMKSVMLRYTCILTTSASGYTATPIIDVVKTYAEEGVWNMDFAYFIWYPFDAYRSGIFELCYLSQFYDGICTCIFILGGDLFMFGILSQIFMHYEYLRREFLSLDLQASEKFNGKVRKLLMFHVQINK